MFILTLRTDKPEAEIGIFDDDSRLAYLAWEAHRALAETINLKIKDILESQSKSLKDIDGIVIYKGPGSFTGLRIGISVANALSDSLSIPITAQSGEDWIQAGVKRLQKGQNEKQVIPDYGAEPKTTKPKK